MSTGTARNLFPSTKEVVGWSLDNYGTLRLLDETGNAVIELTEAEAGIFDGFQPGEGRYVLQSAAAAPVRSAEDLVGDWAIARGTGKPICVLTLANNPAGADNLSLKVKPGCDPFVARFAPTSWQIDRGDLVLVSAKGNTGGSKKTTPTPGCACRDCRSGVCWYGSDDATRSRLNHG